MRRSLALALASLTLGAGSLLVAAQGCSSSALGVQDLCGWLGDECNCYRRFAAGVGARCGVWLDASNNAVDAAGNPYNPQDSKPTIGRFPKRDKLESCRLLGPEGGFIAFDPPLDVTQFPPAGFSFKIVDGNKNECGNGSYASSTSFSIGFPAPAGTGGAGGSTGGAGGSTGGAGGTTDIGASCRESANQDPASEAISSGTFTMSPADPANVVTTTCPNEEQHRFNTLQLDKCDGSANEDSYKALMPTAELEADAGGTGVQGYVRLRILWPPTEPVASLSGAKPVKVEYFDCSIPGADDPCANGVQDSGEIAEDCGYVACNLGCPDDSACTMNEDCTSGTCAPDAMGVKKCIASTCGDGTRIGTETCDDGNVVVGDGCSDTCKQEPGYTCTGEGPGSCVDIDECTAGTDNCVAGATCVNTVGSFTCKCMPGFSSDGMGGCTAGCGDGDKVAPEACDDGDLQNGDGCNENCAVEPGFKCMGEGDGSCVDINECADGPAPCAALETCENTFGSYNCVCILPYKQCNGVCTDVTMDPFHCGNCDNECQPNQTCVGGSCT